VVSRLLELMREAKACGSDLVVFPELALTSFFPRWWMEDEAEINSFFEREMPAPATRPLFEAAKSLGIGFHLGYAELAQQNGVAHRYNTAILSSADIARCICQATPATGRTIRFSIWRNAISSRAIWWRAFGGNVGMCICNDRRWPETYRVKGMQSVELIVLGCNTPTHLPWVPVYDHLADFHNHLCMQAGALSEQHMGCRHRQIGNEEGSKLLAGSCIVAPSGEIVAQSTTATRCSPRGAISTSAATTKRRCSISLSTDGLSIIS
jgi:N-carbamoyl-D-amino-acid hydrolase